MTELREVVHQLVARHGILGAVVGVLEDGRVEAEAAGIANMNSGVEITPDTLFLTGSITKVGPRPCSCPSSSKVSSTSTRRSSATCRTSFSGSTV